MFISLLGVFTMAKMMETHNLSIWPWHWPYRNPLHSPQSQLFVKNCLGAKQLHLKLRFLLKFLQTRRSCVKTCSENDLTCKLKLYIDSFCKKVPPPRRLTWQWKIHPLKMYGSYWKWWFSKVMLVFWGVYYPTTFVNQSNRDHNSTEFPCCKRLFLVADVIAWNCGQQKYLILPGFMWQLPIW